MDLSGELFTMGLAMKLQKMTSEGDPDLLEGSDYVIDFPYPFATASNSDFVDVSDSLIIMVISVGVLN